jgi:O-acetylserine/cysteine efflux transporter
VPLRQLLLGLAVVVVWGTNFVVIRVALDSLPPLAFAALRFTLAFLPAALFIRRPRVRWRDLAAYGVLIGAGQFGLLFIAMDGLISPGLASLVVQSQVFFTIALAMAFRGEWVKPVQVIALVMATAGIGVIVAHGGGAATPFGLALVVAAALSWAGGNHVAKASGVSDMLAFVVWSSMFAVPPLVLAAVLLEGWQPIVTAIAHATPATWGAVVWQSVGNSLFGYAAWGWLLARHPAATITPLAMLVPVFGMGASALLLGEPLPAWKLGAGALVLGGLALNILWPLRGRIAWRRGAGA